MEDRSIQELHNRTGERESITDRIGEFRLSKKRQETDLLEESTGSRLNSKKKVDMEAGFEVWGKKQSEQRVRVVTGKQQQIDKRRGAEFRLNINRKGRE